MVTDFDRNIRTLILSFVIAVMAMIPLRFVEAGEQMAMMPSATVLGESTEEIVLPEISEVEEDYETVLEAPYDEIEAMGLEVEVAEDVTDEEVEIFNEDFEEGMQEADEENDSQVLGATTECISPDNAQEIIAGISQQIVRGAMSSYETQRMLGEILAVQNSICR